MKKIVFWAAAAMMLCAVNLQAQPGGYPGGGYPGGGYPGGGFPGGQQGEFKRPEVVTDSAYVSDKSADIASEYDLTAEQEEQVIALLEKYVSRLNMKMTGFGDPNAANAEPRDYQSMTDAERREMFNQMQERMQQMEELRQDRNKAQKEFDKEIKNILDKEQYKAYTKDRRREDRERQARENQMRGGMGGPGGGFGGPGGGMGGPGGGFGGPGGGFGGPGGF